MTDEVMIKFKNKINLPYKINTIVNRGFDYVKDTRVLKLIRFKVPKEKPLEEIKEELSDLDYIERIENNHKTKLLTNYPTNFDSDLWNLEETRFQYAWDTNTGSLNTSVAVIDDGIDPNHEALDHAVNQNLCYDFINDVQTSSNYGDHGTHVAGTIGANHNGFVGTNWNCELVSLRSLDNNGEGYVSDIVEAIEYASGYHPDSPSDWTTDVISMSIGADNGTTSLEDAIHDARNAGCILVAAAGNDANDSTYTGGLNYPANYTDVIAVGALNEDNPPYRASYSNYGENLDVTAPGSSIKSTLPNNSYGYMSGTSMATPLISGLIALMIDSGISKDNVRQILQDTAIDLGTSGHDQYYGYGMVNANWAVDNIGYIHVGLGYTGTNPPTFDYHKKYPIYTTDFNIDYVIPGTYDLFIWVDANRDSNINSGDNYYKTNITVNESDAFTVSDLKVSEIV